MMNSKWKKGGEPLARKIISWIGNRQDNWKLTVTQQQRLADRSAGEEMQLYLWWDSMWGIINFSRKTI